MELQNLRRLEPTARVFLYVLDASPISNAATPVYFQDQSREPVLFQGIEYRPWPIQMTGFTKTAQGQLPRPKLRVSNLMANEMGELADAYDGMIGARVERITTFERYLDGKDGADPMAVYERDFYIVERLANRTLSMLEFELVCALDVEAVRVPRRIVSPNFCAWTYRSVECRWQGEAPWYDVNNNPVQTQQQDVCSRDLQGCRLRWGRNNGTMRYGAFPGTEYIKR